MNLGPHIAPIFSRFDRAGVQNCAGRGNFCTHMKRRHLAEFGDQPWLAGWWREGYLDCLNFGLRSGGQFRKLNSIIAEWATRHEGGPILELGSGGGGPTELIVQQSIRGEIHIPKIVMSDLFPSPAHYRALSEQYGRERLDYIAEPVSADSAVPAHPLRMICTTFHHFRPDLAARVIADALQKGRSLLIVEPLQRNLLHLLLVLASGPFPYMPAPFVSRRRDWRKFIATLIVPILPLMVMWDGVISVLRTYRPDEIKQLLPPELREKIQIRIHKLPYLGIFSGTCVEISHTN